MELRALRAEHNFTQARVARLIGKSRMEISRLENGLSADPADVLNLLEALGVRGGAVDDARGDCPGRLCSRVVGLR